MLCLLSSLSNFSTADAFGDAETSTKSKLVTWNSV